MQKILSKANAIEHLVIGNKNTRASIGKFSIGFVFILIRAWSETFILKSKAAISLTEIKMYIPML
jgi:hypothetical protein